jgi:hypothetical protein
VGISIGTNAVLVAEHAPNLLICRMGYTTTINDFVHVIVTYANDSTKLYINGKLVRSRPTLCTTVHNIIEPHQLGMALYSPNFSGIIDDFGIWNRALTQKEVESLYNAVNTSSVNNPIYNTLKVYPNPSSTHVIIDNGNYNTMGAYTAKIVNTAGQQVFQSFINQQQFTIDAKTLGGAGVYTLYITDALNKVVGVKKIVLQ